ncbi:MAG: hypothetical protein ACI9OD_002363 [Limisphaerales bacterium]|jgi:hypothetical protein
MQIQFGYTNSPFGNYRWRTGRKRALLAWECAKYGEWNELADMQSTLPDRTTVWFQRCLSRN